MLANKAKAGEVDPSLLSDGFLMIIIMYSGSCSLTSCVTAGEQNYPFECDVISVFFSPERKFYYFLKIRLFLSLYWLCLFSLR